jgi:hypothetical protein
LSLWLKGTAGYREQLEPMLAAHVLPAFQSVHGHVRAKACWWGQSALSPHCLCTVSALSPRCIHMSPHSHTITKQRRSEWAGSTLRCAGVYAEIEFANPQNFMALFSNVVGALKDPDLPVKVDAVVALGSFVEASQDISQLRPILPQLLDEFFKLMNEVESEDLVFTLETIVEKFGEEIAPYAVVGPSDVTTWIPFNSRAGGWPPDI